MRVDEVRELIWQKARELYRDMPWRQDTQPYFVLVSEIMLQQTQVERVRYKFQEFIDKFPNVTALASAPLAEVLTVWSGLGYNRRAQFLHQAAKQIEERFGGKIPTTSDELISLPGIGVNTAGALLAYSFNQPALFIETNVRTVLFYHFFPNQEVVSDRELRVQLDVLLDKEHPREFYWGLMDYGSELKKQGAGQLTKSKHYKKQAPLKGSLREVRGLILKALINGSVEQNELARQMPVDDRYTRALNDLLNEGLIVQTGERLSLAS